MKLGVTSAFVLDLPGLSARLLLLGVDDGSDLEADGQEGVLSVRVVVDSPSGREVHVLQEGSPCELFPGRRFVLTGFSDPLALIDEVP